MALADWFLVQYTEINDYNDTLLFSGGIDPANLPQAYVAGKCIDLYPQQRLRVNTIFEVARAAGLTTAYADKSVIFQSLHRMQNELTTSI